MKLHDFFRSGSSRRLRIALNLKGLAYDRVAVDLRSGAHLAAAFRALNPQGMVPALEHDGQVLIQSPATLSGWKSDIRVRRCCPRIRRTVPVCAHWRQSSVATFIR
jgi:hypothetical protein